ncbi:hypothetical protein M8Z33_23560 [Streptomyces sp. ZAF1911]|uniref:hypothetical protein n=1 Tax=Streptomyces sp. ZAF1911 TaxID=2944129 RepID=UPI00237BAE3E|nr:hypothetical protein [Streptomyces sp. ZAF1911]MDD9379579.1 hypothetical protein [Streptomyces sp. ZAF1911]
MASHRRYTRANGDALAGSLTYALLVGTAPAVLLAGSLAYRAGAGADGVRRTVDGLAVALLPAAAPRRPGGCPPWPRTGGRCSSSPSAGRWCARPGAAHGHPSRVRAERGQREPRARRGPGPAGAALLCLAGGAVAAVVAAGGLP